MPRTLLDGETVVYDARPHLWFFALPTLWGVPVALLTIGWVRTDGWFATALGTTLIPVAAAWVGFAAWRLLQWVCTRFTVSSHRVTYRTGVFARHGVEIPMERVANVNFSQSVLERVFGAGDLVIESSGVDGQSKFSDIRHPDDVQLQIHAQIAAIRPQWSTKAPAPALAAELAALAELHQNGTLSATEFAEAKRRLLG